MDLSKFIGNRIKTLRKSRGMDQQTLADRMDTSRVTISRYESGIRKANQDFLFKLANTFNVSIDYFFPKINNLKPINKSEMRQVPLVGTIACGSPLLAEQNIEEYVPMFFANGRSSDTIFALKCKGRSMEPTLSDGDIVFVKKTSDVEDGEIAAVLINNDESATLKRIKHVNDQVILMPDNASEFNPIILNKENPGTILGKVIESRHRF